MMNINASVAHPKKSDAPLQELVSEQKSPLATCGLFRSAALDIAVTPSRHLANP